MIAAMNLAVLVGSILVLIAIFTSLISFRVGAPLLLVFLIVGLVAGEDGIGGIAFDNAGAAFFIGSIALAIILFDSGFTTGARTLRMAAFPALTLATVGVLITAVLTAVAAKLLFGFGWIESLLIGAIVSSTDAAAVFFLLRVGDITLRERMRATLEIESGSNDPIAIFLTIALVEILSVDAAAAHPTTEILRQFALQIGLGGIFGLLGGFVIAFLINRSDFEPGLYPIFVMALALALFSATGMAGGSGFLAVYVAGLVAGNRQIRHAVALRRFSGAMTWLAQISMFLALGLLATPSQFVAIAVPAILLGLFLIVLARPIAVWLCLMPYHFSRRENGFIAWVGLRGAVSILLAILPVLGGVTGAQDIFNITFIVVLTSLTIQGWSIAPVARWLHVVVPPRLGPIDRIELELPGGGEHEVVVYRVHPESPVGGGERIPRWARPSLVVRDGRSLRPHNAGQPRPHDQIYIVTTPDYVELLDQLFAAPAESATDQTLFGEFAVVPGASMGELAAAYEVPVPDADAELTVRDFLARELHDEAERGDRVHLGAFDLIVRSVGEDHVVEEVGLSVEPEPDDLPDLPLFQNATEIVAAGQRLWADERLRQLARKIRLPRRKPAVEAVPQTSALAAEDDGEVERVERGPDPPTPRN